MFYQADMSYELAALLTSRPGRSMSGLGTLETLASLWFLLVAFGAPGLALDRRTVWQLHPTPVPEVPKNRNSTQMSPTATAKYPFLVLDFTKVWYFIFLPFGLDKSGHGIQRKEESGFAEQCQNHPHVGGSEDH
jgi:hypothetical protein